MIEEVSFTLTNGEYLFTVCCKELIKELRERHGALQMGDTVPAFYTSAKHPPYVAFYDDGGHGGVYPIKFCPYCGQKIKIRDFSIKEQRF